MGLCVAPGYSRALWARRSAVDHPPGTGKAPGSNPGESTSFARYARSVVDSPTLANAFGVRSVPASPLDSRGAVRQRSEEPVPRKKARRPDLNPWKSQPRSAASRDATEGSVSTVKRRSREMSEHPGMSSSGFESRPARSAGRPLRAPLVFAQFRETPRRLSTVPRAVVRRERSERLVQSNGERGEPRDEASETSGDERRESSDPREREAFARPDSRVPGRTYRHCRTCVETRS